MHNSVQHLTGISLLTQPRAAACPTRSGRDPRTPFAGGVSQARPIPPPVIKLPPIRTRRSRSSHDRRLKNLSKAGSYKVATLDVLEDAASAIDLSSGAACWWPSCSWLIAVECLPSGATECTADSQGNIGRNNVGYRNFGVGNNGISNFGNNNKGNNNWGDNNTGSSNLGIKLSGTGGKPTTSSLAKSTNAIVKVTPKPTPRPPQSPPPPPSPAPQPPPQRSPPPSP